MLPYLFGVVFLRKTCFVARAKERTRPSEFANGVQHTTNVSFCDIRAAHSEEKCVVRKHKFKDPILFLCALMVSLFEFDELEQSIEPVWLVLELVAIVKRNRSMFATQQNNLFFCFGFFFF